MVINHLLNGMILQVENAIVNETSKLFGQGAVSRKNYGWVNLPPPAVPPPPRNKVGCTKG